MATPSPDRVRLDNVQLDLLVLLTGIMVQNSIVLAATSRAQKLAQSRKVPGCVVVVEIDSHHDQLQPGRDVGICITDDVDREAHDDEEDPDPASPARFPASTAGRRTQVQIKKQAPERKLFLHAYLRKLRPDQWTNTDYLAALSKGFRVRVYPLRKSAEVQENPDDASYPWQAVTAAQKFCLTIPLETILE